MIPEDQPDPQCEDSHMDRNPLTFEIPQSLKPFRLRIQIDSIGKEDIVFVDSVRYEGKLCEIYGPTKAAERRVAAAPIRTLKPILDSDDENSLDDSEITTTMTPKKLKSSGTTSIVHSHVSSNFYYTVIF